MSKTNWLRLSKSVEECSFLQAMLCNSYTGKGKRPSTLINFSDYLVYFLDYLQLSTFTTSYPSAHFLYLPAYARLDKLIL